MPARMFFERVVDEKGPMDEAITEAILEVAYLTMCIDTHLDERELRAFAHAAGALLGGEAAKDKAAVLQRVGSWLKEFAARFEEVSVEDRLPELAEMLPHDARNVAYQVACYIAAADSDEDDREFEFDLTLIDGLDLDQAEADELADEVRQCCGSSSKP